MKASGNPLGVVLGACVIVSVIRDVVMLMDSCESTKEIEVSPKKIETRMLDHMELRNSSGLTEKWVRWKVNYRRTSPQI
jgi:hypothetical protein